MKLKKIIAGHLLVLVLVFPQAVSAEDFTFNVPVNVSNIHEEITQVRVFCNVRNDGNVSIGSGSTTVDSPNNGNLMQTITIKFDAYLGKNRADAKSYLCILKIRKSPNYLSFLPSTYIACTNTSTSSDWRCAKEGALFHAVSTGPIP